MYGSQLINIILLGSYYVYYLPSYYIYYWRSRRRLRVRVDFPFLEFFFLLVFRFLRPFMDCLGVLTGISFVDSFDDLKNEPNALFCSVWWWWWWLWYFKIIFFFILYSILKYCKKTEVHIQWISNISYIIHHVICIERVDVKYLLLSAIN